MGGSLLVRIPCRLVIALGKGVGTFLHGSSGLGGKPKDGPPPGPSVCVAASELLHKATGSPGLKFGDTKPALRQLLSGCQHKEMMSAVALWDSV